MSVGIASLLAEARAAGVEPLDAQLLLAHHLVRSRGWVIAHPDARLDQALLGKVRSDLARRAAGVPLAYLTGHREFHGLDLQVTPDVLVPRPETEALVDWALELLGGALGAVAEPAVIDLGTGSGAIALALLARCPRAQVLATDASRGALDTARANAARLGLPLRCMAGDWWAAADGLRFHLALSNPPYVAAGDPHLLALAHEPAQALVGGIDGLDSIRAIVAGGCGRLHAGGWLLLEHGHEQGPAVVGLLAAGGFTAIQTRFDLADRPRCTGGRWAG